MLKPVEVYIVNPFPEIKVCQLPDIAIHADYFTNLISKKSVEHHFSGMLTKQIIEDAFMRHSFRKLVVLKMHFDYTEDTLNGSIWTSYCLLNMGMTELLEAAQQSKRFQDLKAFW